MCLLITRSKPSYEAWIWSLNFLQMHPRTWYPETFDTSSFPKCCAFQKVLIVWCFDPFWGLQQHFKKRVENPLLQAILSRYAEKVLFWTIFRDFPSSVQICHQIQWPNPFRRVLELFKASPVCKGKVLGCTWRKLRDPSYAPYGGLQNMCSWAWYFDPFWLQKLLHRKLFFLHVFIMLCCLFFFEFPWSIVCLFFWCFHFLMHVCVQTFPYYVCKCFVLCFLRFVYWFSMKLFDAPFLHVFIQLFSVYNLLVKYL